MTSRAIDHVNDQQGDHEGGHGDDHAIDHVIVVALSTRHRHRRVMQ